MLKHSFRGRKGQSLPHLTPQEAAQAQELARMAQPYAHMSEGEILSQLQHLSHDPQVAELLASPQLGELCARLSPFLDQAQQQKLSGVLAKIQAQRR